MYKRQIFNPQKPDFDVDPQFNLIGDTASVPDENIRQAKEAWEISDMFIRYDYLGHKLNIKEEPVKVAGVK